MTDTAAAKTFAGLLDLEPHGPDTFVGVSPPYEWGRIYGGQVVAQGLWAAASTVEPDYRPHSLHAYFIRGGTLDEPVRYEVDRIRNGRSFVTRRVVARQSGGISPHSRLTVRSTWANAQHRPKRRPRHTACTTGCSITVCQECCTTPHLVVPK